VVPKLNAEPMKVEDTLQGIIAIFFSFNVRLKYQNNIITYSR
jgi:hypothetical protein